MADVLITLTVTPDSGEPYEVDVDMKTMWDWETQFHRGYSSLTAKSVLDAHDMYELAYVGSKRAGLVVPDSVTGFVYSCQVRTGTLAADSTSVDTAGAPDPTPADQSTVG